MNLPLDTMVRRPHFAATIDAGTAATTARLAFGDRNRPRRTNDEDWEGALPRIPATVHTHTGTEVVEFVPDTGCLDGTGMSHIILRQVTPDTQGVYRYVVIDASHTQAEVTGVYELRGQRPRGWHLIAMVLRALDHY